MGRIIDQRSRNQKNRKTKNIIVIECEGKNKTEEVYFQNFQSRENDFRIEFAYGNDTDPITMIRRLTKYITDKDINLKDGDIAYCVFDTDVSKKKQPQIEEALKIAKEEGIEVIMSVPSFEIWYLLHLCYTTKPFTSNKKLIAELEKKLPEYNKSSNIYSLIKDYTNTAIENAKKLEDIHTKDGQAICKIDCNPSTYVYKTVEYILNQKNNS